MVDRSDNKRNMLVGPVVPVPCSPFWNWFDFWTPSTLSAKTWAIMIPPDGMTYKLTSFSHITLPQGFVTASVYKNGIAIFNSYEGYMSEWIPGSEKAVTFAYPDVLEVTLWHLYSYAWNHYWQISFWREQGASRM